MCVHKFLFVSFGCVFATLIKWNPVCVVLMDKLMAYHEQRVLLDNYYASFVFNSESFRSIFCHRLCITMEKVRTNYASVQQFLCFQSSIEWCDFEVGRLFFISVLTWKEWSPNVSIKNIKIKIICKRNKSGDLYNRPLNMHSGRLPSCYMKAKENVFMATQTSHRPIFSNQWTKLWYSKPGLTPPWCQGW